MTGEDDKAVFSFPGDTGCVNLKKQGQILSLVDLLSLNEVKITLGQKFSSSSLIPRPAAILPPPPLSGRGHG
jgi:hypothetical protein